MSEALAFELAPLGVAVTIVEPGAFRTDFAGGSARVARRSIDEYATGSAAQRRRLGALDGHQPGDAAKLAAAVMRLIEMKPPPVRLALGDDALARARTRLAWVQRELFANEALSRSTALDGAAHGAGIGPFEPPALKPR